ncbi:hypothetical protein NCS52_01364700 [Fusarium sp. LHS14.1]|nr:hypothetical protein NCS52_01364700 [Fusarium sp. LHS14.1]
MSSSESIQQQKRKHGEVADQVINGLEGYSELTPKSQKLRDDLLRTAQRIRDLGDADDQLLGSAFELFEAKQKKAKEIKEIKEEREVIVEQVAKLTGQLESTQAELDDSRSKKEAAERTIDEYHFKFQYGDWLAVKLTELAAEEKPLRKKEFKEFEAIYVALDKANKAEAEEKAKKEAKERGEPFRGPVEYKEIMVQDQAKADANWKAHEGRQVTSLHARVLVERKAVENWLEANDEAIPPPQTPFLDRIEKMSKEAGIERWLYLQWIKEYSDRNEIYHSRPPVAKNYRKTIEKDGKVVIVEPDKKSPEDAVDWESMRAAIEVAKADVETRFKEGRLERETRFEDEDEAGNPILTQLAKKQANALLEGKAKPPASPPREYRREYKKGKWDDIYKARD